MTPLVNCYYDEGEGTSGGIIPLWFSRHGVLVQVLCSRTLEIILICIIYISLCGTINLIYYFKNCCCYNVIPRN